MPYGDSDGRGSLAGTGRLVFGFSLICTALAAIGGYIFLSLRSVELLDRAEAFSSLDEVAVLRAVAKDADLINAEIFLTATTPDPKDKARHLAIIDRLEKKNSGRLDEYGSHRVSADENALERPVRETRASFFTEARRFLALLRGDGIPSALQRIVPQLEAYEAYQKSLGALIHAAEENDQRMIAATSQRIAQTKIAGDVLLSVALLIGAWTGFVLFRMISALRRDRNRLQSEVARREKASRALSQSEERYRALLERIPDAVYVICEGKIVFANSAAQQLLGGRSSQLVVGQPSRAFLLPGQEDIAPESSTYVTHVYPPEGREHQIANENPIAGEDAEETPLAREDVVAPGESFQPEDRQSDSSAAPSTSHPANRAKPDSHDGKDLGSYTGARCAQEPTYVTHVCDAANPLTSANVPSDESDLQGRANPASTIYPTQVYGELDVAEADIGEVRAGAADPVASGAMSTTESSLISQNLPALLTSESGAVRPETADVPNANLSLFAGMTAYLSQVSDAAGEIESDAPNSSEEANSPADSYLSQVCQNSAEVAKLPDEDFALVDRTPTEKWSETAKDSGARPGDENENRVGPQDQDRERFTTEGNSEAKQFPPGPPTERYLFRLDGTVAEVELRAMPSLFVDKPAVQIIARDIADRKKAAETLAAQERQYRLLFEENPSPMWVYDPRTLRFLAVNQAAISHYGFTREEFLARTLRDIWPNDEGSRFVAVINSPDTVTDYGGIWQHQRKDGSIITVDIHSRPIEFDGMRARLATAFDITERVARERKLREREASLDLAQHVAGVGSWEYQLDADGRVEDTVFWSAEVYRIFGKLPEHFRPSRPAFFQAVHPADRARVAEHFRKFQRLGGRLRVDYRIELPNGVERVVAVAAEAIPSNDERVKVVGTIMDITEQVTKAQALEKAEKRYRTIFANASEGIFQSTPAGQFLVVNPAAARIFGYNSPEEMIVERCDITRQSYVKPQRRRDFVNEIEKNGTVSGFECEVFRKDGSKVWISENARAVRGIDGKTIYFEGTIQDISQRKRSEERLREQAELIHLAHDAIMVRDMEDRVEFWNRGAEALYGWTSEEVRGRSVTDLFFGGDEEPMREARRILLQTGTWLGETQHMTKSGGKVTVRGRWSLLRDEFGKPKSKLVINTDLTAQKRFEEQFLRTQRLESIGTLASGIAHDLNNVLLPVLMAAPLLREEKDPAERNKFLDIVEASAKRGASIVRQVVTFARGADGEHILIQPIYLLEEIAKIIRQTFPKSIAVETRNADDLCSIEADPTQLHQILLNLCINARDAMPNGGKITLAAENFEVDAHYAKMTPEAKPGPHIMLQVTDTGSGIPPEVMDKIFDPFFTTKGVGQGTGLGLSTAAGIVKSHHGFIRVYSEPGNTTFKIFLPAKGTGETAADGRPEAEKSPRGHGETILLVDDEAGIRQLADALLVDAGYKVILADDGPAALALFAQHAASISLVVTDIAMPLTSGIVLARALRKLQPEVKIIVSTGRNDDLNSTEINSLVLDGFLRKPYTKRDLLEKAAAVIARQQSILPNEPARDQNRVAKS